MNLPRLELAIVTQYEAQLYRLANTEADADIDE
jgi:hypothetical protein